MRNPSDEDFLLRAVELARRGEGHTRPNPPVGAVVVRKGRIIGEGWHRRCGGDHAEVAALKKAGNCRGATIYVTLEPCSKAGRVGACTDAIIAAGIARVVYACVDPNPKNRGKAARVLAKQGIACEHVPARGANDLIRPFAKQVKTGLPYVTVKLALSLDGRICDDFGNARWVSSERARRMTGRLRERVDAILVGAETVRADDPLLLSHGKRNDDLIRVIVSRSGKIPPRARVLTTGPNATLVYRDPESALRELGRLGVLWVLCEGGLRLATSLAEKGLADEWLTVLAPKVIGHRRISDAVTIGRARILCDGRNHEPVSQGGR